MKSGNLIAFQWITKTMQQLPDGFFLPIQKHLARETTAVVCILYHSKTFQCFNSYQAWGVALY